MKKQTITIVIPAYNEETRLKACLDAIALQTIEPDEVIVVDNNSFDMTAKLASSYKFVTVVKEARQGRVFARDAGFNAASGDILARIDADTILEKDWVARVKEYYQYNCGALTGSCYFYNIPVRRTAQKINNLITYHFNYLISGYYPLWGSNMAFLRKDWLKVRSSVCQRNGLHEDLDLAYHLHHSSIPIYYDEQLVAGVEMRPHTMSRQEMHDYVMMWPNCYKAHHQYSWIPATAGAWVLQTGRWVPTAIVASKRGLATVRRLSATARR